MHRSSFEYGAHESEFEKTGLTQAKAQLVRHPRIAEAAACLECKVERRLEWGTGREMVIGEILLVHAREGVIDPVSKRVSEEHYKPIGRLFANRYCTTRQRFNLPGKLPG
jgi:flavin reductase (DIM6/NTAB) family NADH-FMN oxidoreductase RutF